MGGRPYKWPRLSIYFTPADKWSIPGKVDLGINPDLMPAASPSLNASQQAMTLDPYAATPTESWFDKGTQFVQDKVREKGKDYIKKQAKSLLSPKPNANDIPAQGYSPAFTEYKPMDRGQAFAGPTYGEGLQAARVGGG